MFSARTENGPVTPRIHSGCALRLRILHIGAAKKKPYKRPTHRENARPQRPVLKTTSIVPQDLPVSTCRSLANVMPGKMLVKKT